MLESDPSKRISLNEVWTALEGALSATIRRNIMDDNCIVIEADAQDHQNVVSAT